jgi:hypothetical protein
MTGKELNQLIIASIVNVSLILLLISKAWTGNDKSIILLIFFYPMIVLVNSILWMASKSQVFKITTMALLILFLPVLIVATMY